MSFLSSLAKPFVWIGKAVVSVETWLPKIIGLAAYSENEAKVLTPAFAAVITSVENLSKLVTKDGALVFDGIELIVSDLAGLGGAGALNPAEYAKVISAVSTFITTIHNNPDWSDMFAQVKQLVVNYDALGGEVKAALAKVEGMVGAPAPVVQ